MSAHILESISVGRLSTSSDQDSSHGGREVIIIMKGFSTQNLAKIVAGMERGAMLAACGN